MAEFNGVDYIILAVLFFSTLIGLFRGLVREILAIFTWIGALIIAILLASRVAELFTGSDAGRSVISGTSNAIGANTTEPISLVALGLSFVCLFLLTLIIGSLISSSINRVVEGTGMGLANRLFGGVFGFLRGFLVNLMLVFVVQLTTLDKEPMWKESKLVPVFQPATEWIENLVHPGIESIKTAFGFSIKQASSTLSNIYGN